jgi:hypothetical protein
VALDQLFGCLFDQIIQHAPSQSDLTYCDQMVVRERQLERLPTLRFSVLFTYLLMVTFAEGDEAKSSD